MADISGSIFLVKFVRKLRMQNNTTTSWITKGGNFQTSKKCKTTFILKEFHENKSIKWNLHVDSTPGPHHYDMILGHNVMSKLGIMLHFKDQTMTWDDSTIREFRKKLKNCVCPSTALLFSVSWTERFYITHRHNILQQLLSSIFW